MTPVMVIPIQKSVKISKIQTTGNGNGTALQCIAFNKYLLVKIRV